MYSLPYFTDQDQARVMEFIHAHPFAFLCGADKQNQPVATQIPVFIDQRGDQLFLSGHMMRKTDHHLAFEHNPHVLAVFTGPHTYVSASWYEKGNTASTWNYMSVHARGELRFLGHEELLHILRRTTDHFEQPGSGANFKDLSTDYVESLSKAIVAFEVEVKELKNTFKLSQNHEEKTYGAIVEQLSAQPGDAKLVADEMVKRSGELFKK
ncbi:MAG: hypothetical protein EOO09_14600 [Chitinophagaceae bacterium]|nr:MAG: hypothetical protein EOO09_14600 [Chitinophagaceae bacterium]